MVNKIYLCPSDKKYACSWEGPSDDILQHFSEEHEDLLSFTNSVSVDLREASENKLILHDEEIYLLQSKIIHENLYIFLRYLGPSKIASQITFDIGLEAHNVSLDKHFVTVRSGYFGINLEKIKETFKQETVIDCIISISGDFKNVLNIEEEQETIQSSNVADATFDKIIEDNKQNTNALDSNKESISIVIETKQTQTNNFTDVDSSELPDEVFDKSPDSGISVDNEFKSRTLPRNVRLNSLSDGNSTFYATLEVAAKDFDASLTRSKSLNDECRRKTIVRKNPSVHSLESIIEHDLDLELHCIACENLLYSPIFSCLLGHNVCSNCAVSSEFCKLCSEKITGERNATLEEKASVHLYSCKYKKNGCSTKLPYKDIDKHHISCTFCTYKCPIAGCGHLGAFRNMYHHLKLIHSSTKIFESFIASFQKYNDAFLVHEEKGIFYCCVLNHFESIVWEAKFCGPKERKFFCELKFKERNLKDILLLRQSTNGDCYRIELNFQELKKLKVKSKNAILTITR